MDEYWIYYNQGYDAWDKYFASNWTKKQNNPYEKYSFSWEAWNRGWNMNYNGITEKPFN